ncbi:glucose-1-phosphate cytidylyltransferase [Undibacterium sp. TJN19]|uniref:glucose-1-phosphate cytidylyltransferase n=1 Tax=Undibacterium sp. TJN19 TaxID=3413055 RepID=UPI003BEF6C66
MKAVILAGGLGTRLSEETTVKPKPMVEIGGKPILWHIMKSYSQHGINDFVICCGYKGYLIKEYFANYFLHTSNVTIDLSSNAMQVRQNSSEPWRISLVDTGENSMTGGRLRRVRSYLDEEDFCFTYGDGVADVNISALLEFHRAQGRLATVTASKPPIRFGVLNIEGNQVTNFREKSAGDGVWINAGFFVLSPKIFDLLENDATVWEKEPLEKLANSGQLSAFQHPGFWHPMDTLRDKNHLEELWNSGQAPWKTW